MFKHSTSTFALCVALLLIYSVIFQSFPVARGGLVLAKAATVTEKKTDAPTEAQANLPAARVLPPPAPVDEQPNAPLAVAITATNRDFPMPGSPVQQGDSIKYEVTITNNGTSDATSVNYNDTIDPNTSTLVAGSAAISPIAVADTYAATGNAQLNTANIPSDVRSNDVLNSGSLSGFGNAPGNANGTAIGGTVTTTNSGTVVLNSNGTFTYTSAPGFTGTDSFYYTATNMAGPGVAKVTINVSNTIWFVNAAAGPGGNGTQSSPFNCLVGAGCFDPVAADDPGDIIFLYSGSYTGGLTLLANQKLVGEGATASLSSISGIAPPAGTTFPATGGTKPVIGNTVGSAVILGNGNTLNGFTATTTVGATLAGITGNALTTGPTIDTVNIGPTTGAGLNITNSGTIATSMTNVAISGAATTGINANDFGTLTINSGVTVAGAQALILTGPNTPTGSTVNGTFGTVTATGGTNGIALTSVHGTITIPAGSSLSGASGDEFLITGNQTTINVTYQGDITYAGAANAIRITATTGVYNGNITFDTGNLSVTGTTGISVAAAGGTHNYYVGSGGANINDSTSVGVNLGINSNGAYNFGTGFNITNTLGPSINVSTTAADVTYSGNITQGSNAPIVGITSLNSSGFVTFQTGTLSATNGAGISLADVDGPVSFNGTTTLNGGDAAIDVTAGSDAVNGSVGTITFGANASITNPTGAVIDIQGSRPNFTYSGTFTKNNNAVTAINLVNNKAGLLVNINGSSAPKTISTTTADAIVLNGNNASTTVNFSGGNLSVTTTTGIGVNANVGGTLTFTGGSNNISSGNTALLLSGYALGSSTLNNVTATGGTNGISLTNCSGSLAISAGALSGATGPTFAVVGGTVNVTHGPTISQSNNAAAVSISGGHNAPINFNGNVTATNGTGLQFDNADGFYNFNATTTLNGGDAGIDILNGSSGNFSFVTGTSLTHNVAGTAFNLTGSNANVTYSGSITDNNGRAVDIDNHDAGTITFNTGAISASGASALGIRVQNSNGGAVNVSGQTTLSTQANTAVDLGTNNGSGTVNFNATGNGLDITTTSGAGFLATGGGTVTVTGSSNTVTSGTGTALNIANTTIGASGLTFLSISANGAANGIVLNSTGTSGSLSITGNGGSCTSVATCTGGAIQNTTSHGISLNNTLSPSFTRIGIQNTSGSGIDGTAVTNFTLDNSFIDNSATGGGPDESNVSFDVQAAGTETNISGVVTITNNTLTNSRYHGVRILNFNGTISDLVITANIITSSTSVATSLGSGVHVQALGSPTTVSQITKGNISNNSITNFPSDAGIEIKGGNSTAAGVGGTMGTPGNATNIINITGNSIRGASAANRMGTMFIDIGVSGGNSASRSQANFNISNNGTIANPLTHSAGIGIGIGNTGYATSTIVTNNNVIVANNTVASAGIGGGNGLVSSTSETPDLTWTINNNNISQTDGNGILAVARAINGILKVTINTNTVAAPLTGVRPGIRVDAGNNTAGEDAAVCLDISGNSSAGSGGHPGIGLRKQGTNATVNDFGIENLPGGSGASPGPENHVNSQNPAGGGTLLISATSGFTSCSSAPLLFSPGGVSPYDALLSAVLNPKESADDKFVATMRAVTPSYSPDQQLAVIVAAAVERWTATGLTAKQITAMRSVKFELADLPGAYLAEVDGYHMRIDRDAGGYGWFVDATPMDDVEFGDDALGSRLYTNPAGEPAGRIDLLTAVMHEIGHHLNLPDSYVTQSRDNLMYGYLTKGERRVPVLGQAQYAKLGSHKGTHYLSLTPDESAMQSVRWATTESREQSSPANAPSPPVKTVSMQSASSRSREVRLNHAARKSSAQDKKPNIPTVGGSVSFGPFTLSAGSSVTIVYTVTINNAAPPGASFVRDQGTVTGIDSSTGDPFTPVVTDDPDTGAPNDETRTNLIHPTASSGTVTGRITADDGTPVEGAVVLLSGTQNRKFITDANGFYRFENVETNGFYNVTPSRVNYTFTPAIRSFSQIGETTEAAFGATATGGNLNPLDTPEYFVRQHYLDFLGREPDEAGFNFWSDQILGCGDDTDCVDLKRQHVSAAYFFSIEFQETGGFVDGLYRVGYGVRPTYADFKPDAGVVADGVQVGKPGWEEMLAGNKAAFLEAFVQRAAFQTAYGSLSNEAYVDALIANTGVAFTTAERDALVGGLEGGGMTRATVLRAIVDNGQVKAAKRNEAFVMMEYFGYLRREPDPEGYGFWLNKLEQFNGNFEQAEMVRSFIISVEYRDRFPR